MSRRSFIAFICALLPVISMADSYSDNISKIEITETMDEYIRKMKIFTYNVSNATANQFQSFDRMARIMDSQWMTFFQSKVDVISEDDALMELATEYERLRDAALDSLNLFSDRIKKTSQFIKAEQLLIPEKRKYELLWEKARKLALVKQTASQLERLKADEELEFAAVQKAYGQAREAAEINPLLRPRLKALQDVYIDIKLVSDEIKAMEYQPLLKRIKDYLIGLAAVAIILMFIMFIGTFINTIKKAKEAEKKMKDALDAQKKEIPTI